ncbi:MAG: ATP-binding protein [Thermoanaerobaculales bacterium]|nr:ATP-binding protein [Thermoanaerobaculales bacterium]
MEHPSSDALLSVVAEWLDETELPDLVPREATLPEVEKLRRVLAIVGPRRAGKTFLMYQLIAGLERDGYAGRRDILFVDFEDYRLTGFDSGDVDALLAAFQRLAGKPPRFLFFDEIQRLPNWSRVLRTLHNQGRYTIVVSGSNSKLLHPEIATELRGRYEDLLLFPFSFGEYLRLRNIEFTPATRFTTARGRLVAAFEEYLHSGGFPEVVLAPTPAERRKLLQNYFRTIFYRDVVERYNIRARSLLEGLMGELLESHASLFSIGRFEKSLKANGLPGSKRTISNYLQYLQEAFFLIANEKFSHSPRKRLMNPKKVYLVDTGFAALGRSFSENRGRILENLVAVELHRRGEKVSYFKGRHECDFVVSRDRRPVEAIQVCWELNPRNQKRELTGLAEAVRTLGVERLSLLTFNQRNSIEIDNKSVTVLPVWEWLLHPERGPGTADYLET